MKSTQIVRCLVLMMLALGCVSFATKAYCNTFFRPDPLVGNHYSYDMDTDPAGATPAGVWNLGSEASVTTIDGGVMAFDWIQYGGMRLGSGSFFPDGFETTGASFEIRLKLMTGASITIMAGNASNNMQLQIATGGLTVMHLANGNQDIAADFTSYKRVRLVFNADNTVSAYVLNDAGISVGDRSILNETIGAAAGYGQSDLYVNGPATGEIDYIRSSTDIVTVPVELSSFTVE